MPLIDVQTTDIGSCSHVYNNVCQNVPAHLQSRGIGCVCGSDLFSMQLAIVSNCHGICTTALHAQGH